MSLTSERDTVDEIKVHLSEWGLNEEYYFAVHKGELEPIEVHKLPIEPHEEKIVTNLHWSQVPEKVEKHVRSEYGVNLEKANPYDVYSDSAFEAEMKLAEEYFRGCNIWHANDNIIPEKYQEDSAFFVRYPNNPDLVRHFAKKRGRCTFSGLGEIDGMDFVKFKVR